jgi:polysaccharide deacetylase family protein (PEP-CTERM system associated)
MKLHALSFDVENWYDGNLHRDGFTGPADDRVVGETYRVLEILAEAKVHGTFFTLGKVAAKHPHLVRAIAAAGHEVACHSYDHERIFRLTPAQLLADLTRARGLLQDLSGQPVTGFRAPSWSMHGMALKWAPAIIAQAGFAYDSSVFPMRTPYYGAGGTPVGPWHHDLPFGGTLLELPPAVARFGPLKVPYGGGIYWRLLPDWMICRLMDWATEPSICYLHPWELNATRVPSGLGVSWLVRGVLTTGVEWSERSLRQLLGRFQFGPIAVVFANHMPREVKAWVLSTGYSAANTPT